MARYGMVIDTVRCVGCMDCVVVCKTENGVPEGYNRDWIVYDTVGAHPTLHMEIRSERCNHCDNPPCVYCCPCGASHIHDRGGVVLVHHDKCSGCKACIAACPYDARFIHPEGYADKCTFCIHRVEKGLDPACVAVCPTHCMHFGDMDDPNSEVRRLARFAEESPAAPRSRHETTDLVSDLMCHPLVRICSMHEIISTRNNPMIDPTLHIWGWEIPVYLFLGGMVAGMMIISGYFLFKGRHREMQCSCLYLPTLSIVLLSLGMLALFLDLSHRWYFWRMYMTFQPASPMSWGSWILLLVYPALVPNGLIRPPGYLSARFPILDRAGRSIIQHPTATKSIGVVNMLLGGMLGIYTGILLSAFGARPLWNSAMLGLLFLVSGLSSAAAFVHLTAKDPYERTLLAKADNGFLTIELFIIALYLIGLVSSTQVHIEAAQLLLSGPFAPAFWVFVIGLGIVIPLIVQSLATSHRIAHTPVAPILVVVGGLLLRFVIVDAGQASHWTRTALMQ